MRLVLLLSILLAACDSRPPCPFGEPVESWGAPFDAFQPPEGARICKNTAADLMVYHRDAGGVESVTAAYERWATEGGRRRATSADTTEPEETPSGDDDPVLLVVAHEHLYRLWIKRAIGSSDVVQVQVRDVSDALISPERRDLAERARAVIAPALAALEGADTTAGCPQGRTPQLLVLSQAEARRIGSRPLPRLGPPPEAMLSAFVEARAFAIDRVLERQEPTIDAHARTYEPGRVRGEVVVFIDGEPQCRVPWSAANDPTLAVDAGGDRVGVAASSTLVQLLDLAAGERRREALWSALRARETTWSDLAGHPR